MSNSAEQLAYNPSLVGDHMYAITEIEKRQPFTEAHEQLVTNNPVLYQAGILAVKGCQLTREGQRRQAVATFDEGRDLLEVVLGQELPLTERIQYEQLDGALSLYRTWARPFVWKSRHEQQVLEARSALWARTALSLGEASLLPRSEQQGTPTELSTVALLERQMHPQLLTTHALPHHDQGKSLPGEKSSRNRNFDVLTTELRPEKKPRFYRLQCKTDCLGVCQEFYGSMNFDSLEVRRRARLRVATSVMTIKEISGCCDLGLWHTEKIKAAKDPISLLTQECRGKVSAEETAELDALSNSLTLTASLPKRILEANKNFPLAPLARKEYFRRRDQAQLKAAAEARRLTAEYRRENARAGIARVMGASAKAS